MHYYYLVGLDCGLIPGHTNVTSSGVNQDAPSQKFRALMPDIQARWKKLQNQRNFLGLGGLDLGVTTVAVVVLVFYKGPSEHVHFPLPSIHFTTVAAVLPRRQIGFQAPQLLRETNSTAR